MDEKKENKSINILEEIFSTIDKVESPENGEESIKLFATILAMPDDQFDILRPVLEESFNKTFNTPESQLEFAQMMNINGIRAEDLTTSFDDIITAVNSMTEVELSDSKKDFLKEVISLFINSLSASEGIAKRVIQIPIELCRENAKLPTYATTGSAAMDVYSPEEYTIKPGETVIIPLGFKVNIPKGYALLIQPRSGMSVKTKLRVANTPGLIDSDYHNEIGLIIENISDNIIEYNGDNNSNLYGSSYTIGKGERCAQMRLIEVPMINWFKVNSIGNFDEDHGAGFGSTGKK